ncbi:MAG TPA: hypothetical protein VFI42_08765 [Thermomicrobiaceae bacterium]|nr:hypothetical protein [Thermomicrobiaceae bacterium]
MDPMIAEMMIRQRHAELAQCKRQSRPQYAQYGVNWLRIGRSEARASQTASRNLLPRLIARLSAPRHAAQW